MIQIPANFGQTSRLPIAYWGIEPHIGGCKNDLLSMVLPWPFWLEGLEVVYQVQNSIYPPTRNRESYTFNSEPFAIIDNNKVTVVAEYIGLEDWSEGYDGDAG